MRNRLPLLIAATVLTVTAGVAQVATAWEWGRLDLGALSVRQQLRGTIKNTFGVKPNPRTALAARQDLRDEVCMAMADGRLNSMERRWILNDAKEILTKEEYPSFRQWINRLSPPPKTSVRRTVKTVRKEKEVATTLTIKKPAPEPTIPTNILRAERMASMGRAR